MQSSLQRAPATLLQDAPARARDLFGLTRTQGARLGRGCSHPKQDCAKDAGARGNDKLKNISRSFSKRGCTQTPPRCAPCNLARGVGYPALLWCGLVVAAVLAGTPCASCTARRAPPSGVTTTTRALGNAGTINKTLAIKLTTAGVYTPSCRQRPARGGQLHDALGPSSGSPQRRVH
jgi:hypothetical protein